VFEAAGSRRTVGKWILRLSTAQESSFARGSTSSDDDIFRGIWFYSLPLPSGSFPINYSLIILSRDTALAWFQLFIRKGKVKFSLCLIN
jgi:hypothetical protein